MSYIPRLALAWMRNMSPINRIESGTVFTLLSDRKYQWMGISMMR